MNTASILSALHKLCRPGRLSTFLGRGQVIAVCLLLMPAWGSTQESEQTAISAVLDAFHAAAAEGDWDSYFDLMSADGVFLGTDAGERWPKEEFRSYAGGRNGWVYHPVARNINLTPDGNAAWFDEILNSESYGTSRGTGVLIKTRDGWKISQYHLTFPVPNPLAGEITDRIKAFEAGR